MGFFDFLRPRAKSPLVADGRYDGRPLLILLENYVMSAVGCLETEKERAAAAATQRVFGGGDDWRTTLRAKLQLGDSLDDELRDMWVKNQDIARNASMSLSPQDFARRVADENFAQLLPPQK